MYWFLRWFFRPFAAIGVVLYFLLCLLGVLAVITVVYAAL